MLQRAKERLSKLSSVLDADGDAYITPNTFTDSSTLTFYRYNGHGKQHDAKMLSTSLKQALYGINGFVLIPAGYSMKDLGLLTLVKL